MREFTNMMDLLDEVQDLVERQVSSMRRVPASDLGLDNRCGFAYVDGDMECIVVDDARARSFDYYGGFEYVADEDKRRLGDYVVYLNTCDRVSEALECLMEKEGLCDSDDGYEDRGSSTCGDKYEDSTSRRTNCQAGRLGLL